MRVSPYGSVARAYVLGTTETVLTAHIIMGNSVCDDALLTKSAHEQHDKFGIEHATSSGVW